MKTKNKTQKLGKFVVHLVWFICSSTQSHM